MYERNYHDSVLSEEKPAAKKKKKKKFSWKTALSLALCVAIVSGFVTSALLSRLQVRNVEVTGANSADPKDVAVFVTDSLEGKWLYVFPKTSMVLLPDRALEKSIQRAFPKFASVAVARSGTQTVTVTVTEYEGVYLWCVEDSGECSFMSGNGVVFAPAPFFSGNAYTKLFIGEWRGYPFTPIGAEQLLTVAFFLERMRAIAIEPSEFHFYNWPQRVEIVFYHNGGPARLILDPNIAPDTTLQSFFTAIRTAPFSTRFRNSISVLEYIDVRLPNKVVYKFR